MGSETAPIKWPRRLFFASLVLLFVGALSLHTQGSVFVSPDETAAHFFSATFAATGHLFATEPRNLLLNDALHPRSVLAIGDRLLPASFLGLPVIVGFVAKLFGTWSIPFLLIALSFLAMIVWMWLWRQWLGDRTGYLIGAFSAVLPAWWYYTARSLMPNVLFVSLVIFAVALLVWKQPKNQEPHSSFSSQIFSALQACTPFFAGICFGLALFVRTSEAIWVGLVFLALIIWLRRQLTWKGIVAFVIGAALALTPMFILQQSLYGSPFATGYTATQDAANGAALMQINNAPAWWQHVENVLSPAFPFGLHPQIAWQQFVDYGLGMFWWIFLLAAVGIWQLAASSWQLSQMPDARCQMLRRYLVVTVFISVWLILMYGSWTFTDNPDPTQITLGNSHVRYWLPIFLLMVPFVGIAIDALMKRAGKYATMVLIVVWLLWTGLAFRVVFLTPQDGLMAEAVVLQQSRTIHDAVIKLTEQNAIIIVDRGDKLFFPDRAVLYPLRDPNTFALLPKLASLGPTYYYGITLPATDLNYLNADKLKGVGLTFQPVQTFGIESLYKIAKTSTVSLADQPILTPNTFSTQTVRERVPADQGVFRFTIGNGVPPYTFHVVSFSPSANGFIDIFRGSDLVTPVQILMLDPNMREYDSVPQTFTTQDINFDGYQDIGILVDGGAKWGAYQFWTFNPQTGLFEDSPFAQAFQQISFNDITFNAAAKEIVTNNFLGTNLFEKDVYQVTKNQLHLFQDYQEDQIYTGDEPINQCTTTVKTYVGAAVQTLTRVTDHSCTSYTQDP